MKLPATIVPEYDTAVSQFESMGGHLTHVSQFGIDPVAGQGHFIDQRYHNFQQTFPDFAPSFMPCVTTIVTHLGNAYVCIFN